MLAQTALIASTYNNIHVTHQYEIIKSTQFYSVLRRNRPMHQANMLNNMIENNITSYNIYFDNYI